MAVIKNRKPSIRQRQTAKAKLENPKLEGAELVAAGGYGESVQHTPQKALQSKGYIKALGEYGLTEELVTTALVEDINKKPQKRFSELSLGAEILGMKQRSELPPMMLMLTDEQIERILAAKGRKRAETINEG